MTCANWKLTILAAVILVLTLWPNLVSATVGKWAIIIASVLILIATWTIVECKPCLEKKKKGKK